MTPANCRQRYLRTPILYFSSLSLAVEPVRGATLEAVRIARAASNHILVT
ncbi:MAG: hypothetical protein M1299_07465 [Firmicutes bacterium]|nr:hypothetical protein [Bacillota bacterium]MCL5039641.1 hypothetical protein [Bacillota bacterium]